MRLNGHEDCVCCSFCLTVEGDERDLSVLHVIPNALSVLVVSVMSYIVYSKHLFSTTYTASAYEFSRASHQKYRFSTTLKDRQRGDRTLPTVLKVPRLKPHMYHEIFHVLWYLSPQPHIAL
jgi:hypothetical protein